MQPIFAEYNLAELTGNPWNQLFPMSQHLSSGLTHEDIGSTCLHMKDDKWWCFQVTSYFLVARQFFF